jgi:hypothetical protein
VVEERFGRAISHRYVDQDAGRGRFRASLASSPNQHPYAFVTRSSDSELVGSLADQATDLSDRNQRIVDREDQVM